MSRELQDPSLLPALDRDHFRPPDQTRLSGPVSRHKPRILLLHGPLRERSYSRFLADEAERLLIAMGCENPALRSGGLAATGCGRTVASEGARAACAIAVV
jgi:hypothetical protein